MSGTPQAAPIPVATTGETVAQRQHREHTCPIDGCRVKPTEGIQYHERDKIALKWAKHQRSVHRGHGQTFLERARASSADWAKLVQVCKHPGCGQVFKRGGVTNHQKACAYRPAAPLPPLSNGGGGGTASVTNPAPTLSPDAARYAWNLAPGQAARTLLDSISVHSLLQHDLPVSRKLKSVYAPLYTEALTFVLRGLKSAMQRPDEQLGDAWAKLWHLLPCLLLCPDGSISRERRFRHFAVGHISFLVTGALSFAKKRAQAYHRKPRSADAASVAHMARRSGGLKRAAACLRAASLDSPPRNQETFDKLLAKHPAGDAAADLAQAEQEGWDTVQANPPPLSQYDEIFTAKSITACLQKADNTTTPGVSGLSVLHLQSCLNYGTERYVGPFTAMLVWLARSLYGTPRAFPPAFRQLHSAARLFGVGAKVRPIACNDTLRRIFARIFCWHHKQEIGKLLAPIGQFGCGTPSGTDVVATTVQMLHDAGGIVISTDGSNAFNALSRSAMYRAVAKYFPSLYAYLLMLYGSDAQPSLVFSLDDTELAALMQSRQGIQQGDALGPLLWCLSTLPILQGFKEQFPDLPEPSFLDDTFIGSTGVNPVAQEVERLMLGYQYLDTHLAQVNVHLNLQKACCILPKDPERAEFVQQQCTQHGMRCQEGAVVVGVPVGPPQYVQRQAADMLHDAEALRLLRGIVNMGETDSQVAYALLRMCYVPKVMHLARNVPPDLLMPSLLKFDALSSAALAAILQEPAALDHAEDAGPNDPSSDWDAAVTKVMQPDWDGELPVSFSAEQQQQLHLRHRDGGLGVAATSDHCYAAYMGRSLAVLGTVLCALSPTALQALLPPPPVALPALSVLTHIRTAAAALHTSGVPQQRLQELMQPAFWQLWHGNSLPLQEACQNPAQHAGLREVPAHLQAKLSHLVHELAKEQFWSAIRPRQDAQGAELVQQQITASRWLSQSSKGAMSWAGVKPSSDEGFTLPNAVFKETARRALGVERLDPGGLCGNSTCSKPATAVHSRSCTLGGEYAKRHTACVGAMHKGMTSDAGVTGVVLEDRSAHIGLTDTARRSDILIPAGQLNTAPKGCESNEALGQIIDHVYPDGTCATYRAQAAQTAGYAALSWAKEKHQKYRGTFATDQYTLIPFALDQFGAACEEAHRLIQALARRQSQRSGGAWPESQCVARWRQRMSVALQRAVSESVARTFARCTQPLVEGGPAPRPWLYRSVKLLVV